MTSHNIVLLADNLPDGQHIARTLNLDRNRTLIFSEAEQLRGWVLPQPLEIIDRTVYMSLGNYKALMDQLRTCQILADPQPGDVAEAIVGAATERLRAVGHSWAPGHVLAHAMLTELLAVSQINREFLQTVTVAIEAALPPKGADPEPTRTPPTGDVTNTITGPVNGTAVLIGRVHGVPVEHLQSAGRDGGVR